MSTAELKRELRELGATSARLAQCIERPDFEALLREMVASGATKQAHRHAEPTIKEEERSAAGPGVGRCGRLLRSVATSSLVNEAVVASAAAMARMLQHQRLS
jgi:phage gpG-like protein